MLVLSGYVYKYNPCNINTTQFQYYKNKKITIVVEIELFRLHATDRLRVSNLWTKTEIPNKDLTQEFSNIVNY